jgi:hypothetical protein
MEDDSVPFFAKPSSILAGALIPLFAASGCATTHEVKPPPKGCSTLGSISTQDQQALERAGQNVLNRVRAGDFKTLWQEAHPALAEVDTSVASSTLQMYGERLLKSDDTTLERMLLAEGVRGEPGSMMCGEAPGERVVFVASGVQDRVAMVSYRATFEPQSWDFNLRFWPDGRGWRLVNIEGHLSNYLGRDAADWVDTAERLAATGESLTAYWALTIATELAPANSPLATPETPVLHGRIQALYSGSEAQSADTSWSVEGDTIQVVGLGMAMTLREIAPEVHFIATGQLEAGPVESDAARLLAWMTATNPSLLSELGSIAFIAYAEPPLDPSRFYRSHTVILPTPGVTH